MSQLPVPTAKTIGHSISVYAIVDCGVSDEALLADISKHGTSFYGFFFVLLSIFCIFVMYLSVLLFTRISLKQPFDKAVHFMESDAYDQRCIVYGNKMFTNNLIL